jgi:transcriptional regulator with XRE-family HTH domain
MADLKNVVALNLRRLRRANGWTQEELADRVGFSVRYVGQVERGQASMSVTVLGLLADALESTRRSWFGALEIGSYKAFASGHCVLAAWRRSWPL